MINWITEKRNINDLKPAEYNPRLWSDVETANLSQSLEKFSLADPIIINKNNTVIGGHFRLKILKEKGINEVDVRVPDSELTIDQEKELNLRLNRNLGAWDFGALSNFDEKLLKSVGFESDELDKIFASEDNPEDDDVPEERQTTDIVLGDIFQLGEHRVMCGDSTKIHDVENLMEGKKANISFQSPPYNAGNNALGGNKTMKDSKYLNDDDNKNSEEYLSFISSFTLISLKFAEISFVNIQQLAKNKKAVIEYIYTFRDNFVDRAIWFKGGGAPAMVESVLNSRFEDIYIFDCNKNPKRVIRTNKFHNVSNVFEYNPSGKNECKESHAATFPVAFPEHYISFATSRNSIVLDLFLGSGSTLIACEKTNRICYGMEIEPIYVQVIIDRWEKYTGKKAVKLQGSNV